MSLREMRTQSGLTQEYVAKKLNVHQGAISHWETGSAPPTKKYHKMLARLYRVPVENIEAEYRRIKNAKIKKNA